LGGVVVGEMNWRERPFEKGWNHQVGGGKGVKYSNLGGGGGNTVSLGGRGSHVPNQKKNRPLKN